jgi:hypothetical protein
VVFLLPQSLKWTASEVSRVGLGFSCVVSLNGSLGVRSLTGAQILEGAVTTLIGIASFWMVFDFPDQATFLSPIERARVIRRLKDDKQASAEHEEFDMKYFWQAVKDPKTYIGCLIYMGVAGLLSALILATGATE